MTKVESTERVNDFGLIKKLGTAYEYGQKIYGANYYGNEEVYNPQSEYGARIYGDFKYGQTSDIWGIYQRRHNKGKVIYARLKFYTPANPQTAPQQSHRATFSAGMTAWGSLTQNQKDVYNERAKKLALHGVNLYMREYLNSN